MRRPGRFIVVATLAAILAGMILQWQIRRRLNRELTTLRHQVQQEAAARERRERFAAPGTKPASLATRRTDAVVTPPQPTERGPRPTTAEEKSQLSALVPAKEWKDAGRTSPTAAFETFEWALNRGDTDALAASMTFSPETRSKLDAFFAKLSDEVRAKYPTPESILGLLAADTSGGPLAFQVLGEAFDGPDSATVRARIQEPNGRVAETTFRLRRAPDGWKALVSEQQALEKMNEFFPEIVWQSLGSKSDQPAR